MIVQPAQTIPTVYTFYVSVRIVTETMRIDITEETDFTREQWVALSDAEREAELASLFQEWMGNLCDHGWYEGEPEER